MYMNVRGGGAFFLALQPPPRPPYIYTIYVYILYVYECQGGGSFFPSPTASPAPAIYIVQLT